MTSTQLHFGAASGGPVKQAATDDHEFIMLKL